MNKFLVTYDLVGTRETSADYERLIARIKKYSNWGRVQKSVWLIQTVDSAVIVRDELRSYMDDDDRLFVIEVTGTAAWHRVICEQEWLKNYLNA